VAFAEGFAGPEPKNIKTAPTARGCVGGPDGALYVAETVKGKIWRFPTASRR